jgi:hypothetical protein
MSQRRHSLSYLPGPINPILFYGLTFALLIPLWGFKYFPSQDGPLHQYNAVVLHNINRPDRPAFREFMVPNPKLVPNWVCPHVLPILLRFCSSIVAEKLLLSVYLILFPLSVRYALGAIRPRAKLLALAALPMVPNQFYHLGFQDFCLSLAGYFFIAGYFLKHRRHFDWANVPAMAVMLLLLYITHLVSVVMVLPLICFTALALYWLRPSSLGNKVRRTLPVLTAMLPVILMAAYFALQPHHGDELARWPKGWHHRLFLIPLWMKSYQYRDMVAAIAVLLLFLITSIWLLFRERRQMFRGLPGGLLLTTISYLLLYLVAPDAFAGAQVLLLRVAAYIFFAALLWWGTLPLGSRAFARLELVVALVSIPAALGLLASHLLSYAQLNTYLTAFEAIAPLVPPGSTLVPIHFNDPYTLSAPHDGLRQHLLSTGIDPFRHASSFGLAEKGVVNLGNSWPSTDHQSLKWLPGLDPITFATDRLDDFAGYAKSTGLPVDYVLIWTGGVPHTDEQARLIDNELAAGYELIYTSPDTSTAPGYLKLYQSKK